MPPSSRRRPETLLVRSVVCSPESTTSTISSPPSPLSGEADPRFRTNWRRPCWFPTAWCPAGKLRAERPRRRNRPGSTASFTDMAIYDKSIASLDGTPFNLSDFKGKTTLIVNVASKCGLTPQYEGLEKLHEHYKDQGFSVLGVPCNQFGAQEPGSPDEIATFCSTTYGVTFPMTEKVDVNGEGRHPLYAELTEVEDA